MTRPTDPAPTAHGPFAGLVAALLAEDRSTAWTARVPGRLEAVLAAMPAPARAGLRAAAAAVDGYALA
ncbi:hypothetical protein ACFW82_37425, partial [Streptomyces sp. NPDC058728]